VLIIVLWVALGLVSIALYFANSMSFELHAADNSVASLEAQQAIDGAARYVSYLLASRSEPGVVPDPQTYQSEAVPVGEGTFWLISGPTNNIAAVDRPVFGLVDEASKLNLNTATPEMLQALPGMTPALAAAIKDWRDTDQQVTPNGTESDTYLRQKPAYRAKDTNFETIDEVRLVFGADANILYGEDSNLNGILDSNENDASDSPPDDDRNGRLDPGILEYVTVYSREGVIGPDGSQKINITSNQNREQFRALLEQKLGATRAGEIASRVFPQGNGGTTSSNLLALYLRIKANVTADEFAQFEGDINFSNQPVVGLININTAPEAVLACIPGIGPEHAAEVVSFRQSNGGNLQSIAWITEVITDQAALQQAGPYITTHSYQFAADIAAVGHHGRGYQRVKYIFDTSEGTPKIRFRQDLSHLGWALGKYTREWLVAQKENR